MHRWAQFALGFCCSALVTVVAVQPRTASAVYALNSPLGCVPNTGHVVSYIGGVVCSQGGSQSNVSVLCPYDDDADLHQASVTSVGVTGVDNSSTKAVSASACVAPQTVYGLLGQCGTSVNNNPASTFGAFSLTPPHSGLWGGAFGLQSVHVSVSLPGDASSCVQSIIVSG